MFRRAGFEANNWATEGRGSTQGPRPNMTHLIGSALWALPVFRAQVHGGDFNSHGGVIENVQGQAKPQTIMDYTVRQNYTTTLLAGFQ